MTTLCVRAALAAALIAFAGTASAQTNELCLFKPEVQLPVTGRVVDVSAFVDNSDTEDDTTGIQAAIATLEEDDGLYFPAGTYVYGTNGTGIRVNKRNVTVYGDPGTTLFAPNPEMQSFTVAADGVRVYNLRFVAHTNKRGDFPQHHRIVVRKVPYGTNTVEPIYNVVIQGNTIEHMDDDEQSSGAYGGQSAGIFVSKAQGFLVVDNTVRRTRADGIHVTGGSGNGRVLRNRISETMDDSIGIVSFLGCSEGTDEERIACFDRANESKRSVNDNIWVDGNMTGHNAHGRGIGIIGGRNITVRNNTVENVANYAGIIVARDQSFHTWGPDNVRVIANRIRNIQSQRPTFPSNWDWEPSGQGAIEILNAQYNLEYSDPEWQEALSVRNVHVQNNTFSGNTARAVRLGVAETYANLRPGPHRNLNFIGNKMDAATPGFRYGAETVDEATVRCLNNQKDNADYTPPTGMCQPGPQTAVQGATVHCDAKGLPRQP